MATIRVLAGDLAAMNWSASATPQHGLLAMSATTTPAHPWKGEIHTLFLSEVSPLTEEKVKKLAETAAWGVAGAVLLGPLGALGGMLVGGNKTEVTFVCTSKCGKQFVGTTDAKFYAQLAAAAIAGSRSV